jgi:broad specificity phosphatase PhoE
VFTLLLIRHATCDHVGRRIVGRMPGVSLNSAGRAQAQVLAEVACRLPIEAVYSGPLERAIETAEILAAPLGMAIRIAQGLDELDFGEWTGRTLDSLAGDPRWRDFNEARARTRIPGGELMEEAVDRAVREIERMERAHAGEVVVAVSHGDVIRGMLLRYLGLSLDTVHRVEVSPGSVSVARVDGAAAQILGINWVPAEPPI